MGFLNNLQKAVSKRSGTDLLDEYSKKDKKVAKDKTKAKADKPLKTEDFDMGGVTTKKSKYQLGKEKQAASRAEDVRRAKNKARIKKVQADAKAKAAGNQEES